MLKKKDTEVSNITKVLYPNDEELGILFDMEKFDWNLAWKVTTNCFTYTNHTILSEALEKWPVRMFSELLPCIYQIIEDINKRFGEKLENNNI